MKTDKREFEAIAKAGTVISLKIGKDLQWLIDMLEFVGFESEVERLKKAKEMVNSAGSALALCVPKDKE